ncbi:MOSC domain-containing protein [Paenibacillus sp. ACRRX]|uniref:MOSC domain-containing protein n=1 Tax=Paenibacillus sp. ACRRX TaxID=2918206 RepID=UPI001EF6C90B|nr:MOSC domain-containing protein [Paenibacillus sp. ACRRX]MCG7409964.1 MOSC domain-containing protein [Paenibacillus sp. ACRRX]
MQATIISLNVALPTDSLTYNGKSVRSGMVKQPVELPIHLQELGFEGDGVADTKHHGGPDKAICVYASEHYAFWQREWDRELPHAAFGENLTTSGLIETDVHIGDTFRIGEAIVQVTQPRQPCFKLAARYDMKEIPVWMQDTGFTGYYLRVLEPGFVRPEDMLTLIQPDDAAISIQYANDVMHHHKHGEEGIARMLANTALSASWRATLTKRLQGISQDTSARIQGT